MGGGDGVEGAGEGFGRKEWGGGERRGIIVDELPLVEFFLNLFVFSCSGSSSITHTNTTIPQKKVHRWLWRCNIFFLRYWGGKYKNYLKINTPTIQLIIELFLCIYY